MASDDGSIVVFLDEANGATTELEVRDEQLYLNGQRCGRSTVVNIVDGGPSKVDKVVINVGVDGWRVGDVPIFVNLGLTGGPRGAKDELTVRGTGQSDQFETKGDFVFVYRETFYPGTTDSRRFYMQASNALGRVEYKFLLGGGADTYVARQDTDNGGAWWGEETIVNGGKGRDRLFGGPVRDKLYGGAGNDQIDGKTGNDRLKGKGGDDTIRGEGGNDYIHGGAGDDDLFGNAGADEIIGGSGRDDVRGGSGADEIKLRDGRKDKRSSGGKGADTCLCDSNDRVASARKI